MALNFLNLDPQTRQFMGDEINRDVVGSTIYISPRLSAVGQNDYVRLLLQAAAVEHDGWLAQQLNLSGRLNATETRSKPSGGVTIVKVPYTAAETMAEGEFNRFYIRALCRRVVEDGGADLIIYRAKAVSIPRPDSEAKIGAAIGAAQLLADLRAHPGVDTALGLPPGPNSGLSARLT